MTTQKTNTQTQIKTDLIEMVQRNYLEKKIAREKAEELAMRNRKARAYSRRCRSNQAKKDRMFAICAGVVFAVVMFSIVACSGTENRYAIARENGNGIHYTYVTERKCTVTEVMDNCVAVSYKGNEYSFYTYDTELKVGDEVVCKFTDNWKSLVQSRGGNGNE